MLVMKPSPVMTARRMSGRRGRQFLLHEGPQLAHGTHLQNLLVGDRNGEKVFEEENRFGDRQRIEPEILDQRAPSGQLVVPALDLCGKNRTTPRRSAR